MRYIKTRKMHQCSVCKKPIFEGEICIQSQSRYNLMYHEACHEKRYQGSIFHIPVNERPEEE